MKHFEKSIPAEFVPANYNVTGTRLVPGQLLNIYGIKARITYIKQVIRPELGRDNPEFDYYLVSFDAYGHAWYHVTKDTDAEITLAT